MNPIPPLNDDGLWRQMLEYLDGTLPADEVQALNARLRSDGELRAVFVELLTQQTKLKELAEEAEMLAEEAAALAEPEPENLVHLRELPASPLPASRAPRRRPRPRRVPAPLAGLAIAASLALIAGLTWYLLQPPRLARLSATEGTVTIERGARRFAAHANDLLRSGDRIETAPNSHATFEYRGEKTDVSLAEATQLRLDLLNGSKQLQLDQGSFEASVAKQKPGNPLKLLTRQAEAIVVGTRFKLLAADDNTRLEVFEGAVRISQGAEGPSLLVPAGNGVTIVPGRPVSRHRLAESRGTILLEQWSADGGPTNQTYLTQFMFSGVGVKPGSSRVRGYLHPPRPGAYSFFLEGSDDLELWLSDSEQPSRARPIASTVDPQAEPTVLNLRADQRYYIELRSHTTGPSDRFTLSWTTPNGQRRVIYGDYLSPFDPDAPEAR
jgi:ferric-dicitrate binding protein FerR (iron transport regulator)